MLKNRYKSQIEIYVYIWDVSVSQLNFDTSFCGAHFVIYFDNPNRIF